MLPHERNATRRNGAHSARGAQTRRERLAFGGVSFELLASDAAQLALQACEPRFALPFTEPRAVAHALCAVRTNGSLPPPPADAPPRPLSDELLFEQLSPEQLRIRSNTLFAELERVAPKRYAVTARIDPTAAGMLALLRGVASGIVHSEGGVVLHAAAAELDGRAVVFVGPSGAGKSTALALSDGARCFAFDNVAIVPSGDGVVAWGLPGGKAVPPAPLAPEVVYPLAAVLRVRNDMTANQVELHRLNGAEALFALRESVQCADVSIGGEEQHLHAALRICERVPVARISTVLGQPHGDRLRAALRQWRQER